MRTRAVRCVAVLLSLIFLSGNLLARSNSPSAPPDDFDEWLNRRVEEITKARINQRNNTNQSESPSVSSNTTSLVDRSSASDLVGVALNLAGLSTESSEMKATSMTATVSAYAFKAATAGRNPLDPDFYNANRDWRRVSFTLGYDYPAGKTGDINERATTFGIKFLPFDKRDASADQQCVVVDPTTHKPVIDQATGKPRTAGCVRLVSDALKETGVGFARITKLVENFLFDELKASSKIASTTTPLQFTQDYLGQNFPKKLLPILTEAEIKRVDDIIADHIDPFVKFSDTTRSAIEQIRKQPQVSFEFLTTQRRQDRPDEYVAKLIAELGVAPRWNFTLNAAFAYKNNKLTKDSRGGMVAAALQYQLTPENKLAGRMPWLFDVSYQGAGMTNATPMHVGQAKLTIPLWEGFELPLSVSLANRTEFIKEKDVRGHFGITFDVARLAQAFKGKLLAGHN